MPSDISLNLTDYLSQIKTELYNIKKDISNNITNDISNASFDISVNSTNYLPQFKSNLFDTVFDNFKVSYILLLGIVVLVYALIFVVFGNSTGSNNGPITLILEIVLWVTLILVIGVNVQTNNYDFSTTLKNLFSNEVTQLNVNVDKKHNKKCSENGGEVFHVPNNTHNYEKARKICRKYNARLATYHEVENAYNNGANWCSYGWSEDQLALFPTQSEIYNNLKLMPGHENDCGRPGVNGGFIDNKHVKFGVNCFGKKPEQTEQDKEFMERLKLSYSPAIDQDELDKIANEKNNMLISPFNKDKWSFE